MRSQHPISDGINRKLQRLIFLILALLLPCLLSAQSFRGSIRGQVVDPNGNVIISGYTLSSNFPVTSNAFQPKYGGDTDAFVAVLNTSTAAFDRSASK